MPYNGVTDIMMPQDSDRCNERALVVTSSATGVLSQVGPPTEARVGLRAAAQVGLPTEARVDMRGKAEVVLPAEALVEMRAEGR